MSNFRIISAGAGSGKTYRLTEEMVALMQSGIVRARGIVATTYTKKAAAELQERVTVRLLEEGMTSKANELTNALIGTVHGLGVKLLQRFAFEAGVSPQVDIIAEENQQIFFNQALATVLTEERVYTMDKYSTRLGYNKGQYPKDWRRNVKDLTDIARANNFDTEVLEKSKIQSYETLAAHLGTPLKQSADAINQQLLEELSQCIDLLEKNEDSTKGTQKVINNLKSIKNGLIIKNELEWHQWIKIIKECRKVGAKSRDDVVSLIEFAGKQERHPEFLADIKGFIDNIFEIGIDALEEYEAFKKKRGLIDYTDMEVQVNRLLDNEFVQNVLKEELDLLMVDEFQDTNPIQLEIFYKLSRHAKHSIWVGDPKQSIYGFRGAEPRLMLAIIEATGGLKSENIQENSWRSREDIVYATNALFSKAFPTMAAQKFKKILSDGRTEEIDQVALIPKRIAQNDALEHSIALKHWHFVPDEKGRAPGKPWMENCIASRIKSLLEQGIYVVPKGKRIARVAKAGDVAILCRSNKECLTMAEALHRQGLQAAIARKGLLQTAEARLILACLKYNLNKRDSLSVAEILYLADKRAIEDIIDDRLEFVINPDNERNYDWGIANLYIEKINDLRPKLAEYSSAEILDIILDELELRRIIAAWGNKNQRFDNVDMLRKFALQYEEACDRLQTASSLGGYLLWLNELENKTEDEQGSGKGEDAVNVLTYHKSKGLEWPIVICHSLESKLKDIVWGMNIEKEKEEVDLNNILGNRWLRFWVNPYADQLRGTNLNDNINQSPFKTAATTQALEEEARVLYVGITRARDYLIFPTRAKTTSWLNRVWNNGDENVPTLDPTNQFSPWTWKDKSLPINTETIFNPRNFPISDIPLFDIPFFASRQGTIEHQSYYIDTRNELCEDLACYKAASKHNYSTPLLLEEEAEERTVSKAFISLLNGDNLDLSQESRLQLSTNIIERYDIKNMVKVNDLSKQSHQFHQHLERQFRTQKLLKNYPIRLKKGGRFFQTNLDIILFDEEQIRVILHHNFSGFDKHLNKEIKRLNGWFYWVQTTLEAIFPNKIIGFYIHFVLKSIIVEIRKTK